MFSIYTFSPIKDIPNTIKFDIMEGIPSMFPTRLQAEMYLDSMKDRQHYPVWYVHPAAYAHVLETSAMDIFDVYYRYQPKIVGKNIDAGERLTSALFFDETNWKDYTSVYSRQHYFKL